MFRSVELRPRPVSQQLPCKGKDTHTHTRARQTDCGSKARRRDGSIQQLSSMTLVQGTAPDPRHQYVWWRGSWWTWAYGSWYLYTEARQSQEPNGYPDMRPATGPSAEGRRCRGGMVSVAPGRYRYVRYRTGCTASLHGLRVVVSASQSRRRLIESRVGDSMLRPTRIPPLAPRATGGRVQGRPTSRRSGFAIRSSDVRRWTSCEWTKSWPL